MSKNRRQTLNHQCTVKEQRELVSKMTDCDQSLSDHNSRYECYVEVSKESRENKACLFS